MREVSMLFAALLCSASAISADEIATDITQCQDHRSDNPTVAQDFLGVNSFCKNIRYVTVVKIWTDIDEEYIREALVRAIHQSITAALSSGENDGTAAGGFMTRLQSEMKAAAVDELIKTPKVFKLVNKLIQVDVYFIPQINSPDNFDNELASNFLVRVNDTNSLSDRTAADDNPADWAQLQDAFDTITELSEDQRYTYLGGVVTASLKLVDLDWDPLVIPDTDNIVKGFIRFRRWYAARPFESTRQHVGQETTLHKLHLGDGQSRSFVTADVSYNFNLANVMPALHSMEVRFGALMDGHGRNMSVQQTLDMPEPVLTIGDLLLTSNREMLETSDPLIVEGEASGFLSGSVEREIYSLAWSFDTQSVDTDRIKANWTLFGNSDFDALMEEHGRRIADDLGLSRFYDLDAQ